MGLSDKVFEALRASLVLNERVDRLDDLARQLGQDLRDVRERLIRLEAREPDTSGIDRRLTRLETIIEMVQGNTPALKKIDS